MTASGGTESDRLAELARLQAQSARAAGHQPGEMVPGAEIIVLRFNPQTRRRNFGLLRWGLVPYWAPDRASPHLHARAETINELPTFEKSFAQRRCIIVTNLFTQRRTIGQPRGREFAFGMSDESDLLIAGVWDGWRIPNTDDWLRTFAVVTTAANEVVGEIHDRMPAILTPDQLPAWFGETPTPVDEVKAMLRPLPSTGMIRWPAKSRRPAALKPGAAKPETKQPDLFS